MLLLLLLISSYKRLLLNFSKETLIRSFYSCFFFRNTFFFFDNSFCKAKKYPFGFVWVVFQCFRKLQTQILARSLRAIFGAEKSLGRNGTLGNSNCLLARESVSSCAATKLKGGKLPFKQEIKCHFVSFAERVAFFFGVKTLSWKWSETKDEFYNEEAVFARKKKQCVRVKTWRVTCESDVSFSSVLGGESVLQGCFRGVCEGKIRD